ncbi:hypothetical protein M9H77_10389 [Catharanthus roseus]|uniref:Uncharacterized protein n=1 Tax=Catharanthus roseus TaxID=4058 RepID=A0ACC0C3M5_CATRO|nr:hypothetical protein M9H77_10389 [Catharanthus roseus]
MEKIADEQQQQQRQQRPPSLSWLLDKNNRPNQSRWLQSTLAELEWRIKKILEVVEENGDTFAERAEMYYQKRPQLVKLVTDLHKSYRALADKYDLMMLRSESSLRSNSAIVRSQFLHEIIDSVSGECDHKSCTSCHNNNRREEEEEDDVVVTCKIADKKVIIVTDNDDHLPEKVEEKDHTVVGGGGGSGGWDELLMEVSELIEENTKKQGELIKRYNKKRDDVKLLMKENRRLRDLILAQHRKTTTLINTSSSSSSSCSNSRWKSALFGKLSFA